MANPEPEDSFRDVISELECLVDVWKTLGSSYMNFESITDLVTQKLVGLGPLGAKNLRGISLNNLGRLVDTRNTLVELDICSKRNYGEHWQILDAFIKKMITGISAAHHVHLETKSDLDCLTLLQDWATVAVKMRKHVATSPESSKLLEQVMVVELNRMWHTFRKGIVVKDDAKSMEALQIAAKLRDKFHPKFHMWIDKIIAQKLRILSIRQAGKSDPSLTDIVQPVKKASALPVEQNKARQKSNKEGTNFGNDDSEAAVSNVEKGKIELKQQNLNTVARVNDHGQESPNHPPPGLDCRTLKAHMASLESRVTAGEDELKQMKEDSDRSIRELDAQIYDLTLHIKGLQENCRKQETLNTTLKTSEANLETEIRHLKERNATVKMELERITEAYKERKAYTIRLYNELVQEQMSQLTKALNIDELKKETEALAEGFQEAKTIIGWTKQRTVREGPIAFGVEDPGEAGEPESDHDDVHLRSTGDEDTSLPETLEDGSHSSIGEMTPISSNGLM